MALSSFVLQSAENSRMDLEQKEELKDISRELNAQPFLKRLIDFSILYFWATTIACESYYEHEEFLRICDGIEKDIFKRFSEIENELELNGLVIKDYVKDKDELVLFYRRFPVEEETRVNSPVLLDILITKRLFDYNSTLHLDLSQQVQKVPSLFLKHFFGMTEYEYEKLENTMLHATLSVFISSFSLACAKVIDEIEKSV